MGRPQPFLCPIEGCTYSETPIIAEKPQIRIHLMKNHDYKQYQKSAFEQKLIPSMMYRSRGFFINLLCDYGIARGINN